MVAMLQAAWRAATSQSSRAHLASAFTAKRCLSDGSSGNGRYVAGQGFVAGEGFSQDQWPPPQPPTHGGFVPHSVDSYAQAPVPPTQGGFVPQGVDSYARAQVPATQGGFIDQARTSAPQQDASYVQAEYSSSYQYGYDYSQYGAPYGAAGFVQAQPYPMQHSHGQFVVDGSAWPPLPPPPLVAPPYTYPPPPPPAETYQPGAVAFQSQAAHGSAYPYVQEYASQQEYAASQQTGFQAQGEQGPAEGSSYASQQAAAASAGPGNTAVESVAEEARVAAQETQVEQLEPTNVAVAAEAAEDAGSHDAAASEEHGGYDATAAAMADAGVLSEDHDSHQEAAEDPEEPAKESSPPEVVAEAPKPAAAPTSSQGDSFLDILAKANLNIRQNKPRPQLGIRSQRKTYARLHNLPRQILKSDVINYFSELNLPNESVHVSYDDKFYPLYVQIAFDSSEAMRNAQKILQTKGRLGGRVVKMESFVQFAPPSHAQISDAMKDYLGRMLLVLHLPQEGRVEDLERFFDGYGYDPSALTMLDPVNMTLARFSKEGNRLVRRAAIGFLSSLEAMRALREKQGDFMLNEPVELRLIQ